GRQVGFPVEALYNFLRIVCYDLGTQRGFVIEILIGKNEVVVERMNNDYEVAGRRPGSTRTEVEIAWVVESAVQDRSAAFTKGSDRDRRAEVEAMQRDEVESVGSGLTAVRIIGIVFIVKFTPAQGKIGAVAPGGLFPFPIG